MSKKRPQGLARVVSHLIFRKFILFFRTGETRKIKKNAKTSIQKNIYLRDSPNKAYDHKVNEVLLFTREII
jgi:hypothetical protein